MSVAAILLLPMRTVQLHQGSLHTCHVGHDAAVTTLCNRRREGKIQTREREKCRVKESYSRPGFCGPGQKVRQVHPANGTTLGNYPKGKKRDRTERQCWNLPRSLMQLTPVSVMPCTPGSP